MDKRTKGKCVDGPEPPTNIDTAEKHDILRGELLLLSEGQEEMEREEFERLAKESESDERRDQSTNGEDALIPEAENPPDDAAVPPQPA